MLDQHVFDQGMRDAERKGRRNYFEWFLLEELATVSEPAILHDLGLYVRRTAQGIIEEEEIALMIQNVADALSRRGQTVEILAPLVLGMARGVGLEHRNATGRDGENVARILERLSPQDRGSIQAGIHAILTREEQDREDHQRALERVRMAHYRRAADYLAGHAIEESWNPEQVCDMLEHVLIRTSEGHGPLRDEFREALCERFTDPGLGTGVGNRLIALAREQERMCREIKWNAAGESPY